MSTATETAITKDDIKALKNFDRVIFRNDKMEVRKEGARYQLIHTIPVSSGVIDFKTTPHVQDEENYTCYENLVTSWRTLETVANFVRPGDVIRLHWERDGNSGFMEEKQVTQDSLYVVVVRKDKGGVPKYHYFMISTSVTGNNSSARLIRKR